MRARPDSAAPIRLLCRLAAGSNILVEAEDEYFKGIRLHSGDLNEGVELSDSGDVLGDEALQGSLQLNFLGFVPFDVLEQVPHLCCHIQLQVVLGIVCTLNVVVAFLLLAFLFI